MALLAIPLASFCQQNVELNFTAVNGPATVAVVQVGQPTAVSLQVCFSDDREWRTYGIGQTINLTSGSTVYFRTPSAAPGFNYDDGWEHHKFSMTGTVAAAGNVMSLLDPTMQQTTVPKRAFYGLFEDCSSLITAPLLPAVNLDSNCYENMFDGCTSLTVAPQLPASNFIGAYCYLQMFRDCSSLTDAPVLASTTLGHGCYDGMFINCTSLVNAPVLPATELKAKCYTVMFFGCTSLTAAPELPADSVPWAAYAQMFDGCTSLAEAPELPATILGEGCYGAMFANCSTLTTIPELPATSLPAECYAYMFAGCSSLAIDTIGSGRPWSINASTVGEDALTYMFTGTSGTMNGTPELDSIYYISSETHTVTIDVNDTLMGSVDVAGGIYHYGDTLTVAATAKNGYRFVEWSNGDTTDAITFVVTSDTVFVATFEEIPVVAVENVDASEIFVIGADGYIIIEGASGRSIAVCDALGRLVATKNRIESREIINVPAQGVYFVNVDGWSIKVIIK